MSLPDLICSACGRVYPVESLAWRCECGAVFDVAPFDVAEFASPATPIDDSTWSLWRYAGVLPLAVDLAVSMGEGMTPLVTSPLPNVRLKADLLMPTGSFKDRGAVVLATLAKQLGVTAAVVDSSGNAGTAAAAYLARAGVACRVFVPASTSPGKLAQIRAHGADIELIGGSRADTADAAMAAASQPGVFYASHVFHPYFLHGVKTYGYEIWESSGQTLPDTVVVPVGNGTMVLGCHLAFGELVAAGLAERAPAIVAVQTAGCAPLADAFARGDSVPATVDVRPTVAEGIAIMAPARGKQILAAVAATGGAIVSVGDDDVLTAKRELAADGWYVEPTSAVCWAAVRAASHELLNAPDVVVPLCGTGLKTPGY